VFMYLDIFDPEKQEVQKMKDHYTKGGLGDVVCKKRLLEVLDNFLTPIREKRKKYEKDPKHVLDLIIKGSQDAKIVAAKTLKEVKDVMHMY